MAIELCSAETIPRISFSHYLCCSSMAMQQNCPLRSTSLPLNSNIDFKFDIQDQECYCSSADELFSNGKILPLQIKRNISQPKQVEQPPPHTREPQPQAGNSSSKDQNQSAKAFWQFKRSSSLNFVSGYKRRLCSSSTLLSRSSSTGSAPKVKPGQPVLKDGRAIGNHRKGKSLSSQLQSSTSNQKPPLQKCFTYGSPGNGFAVNPILHVPLVDVFCLSSAFSTGKDKK